MTSEFETAFTGGIGVVLDTTVVQVAIAVENDRLDTCGLGGLGNLGTHQLGLLDLGYSL
jgi:hypothetical protein